MNIKSTKNNVKKIQVAKSERHAFQLMSISLLIYFFLAVSKSYAAIQNGAVFQQGSQGGYVWTESVDMSNGYFTTSCFIPDKRYFYSMSYPVTESAGYSSDGVYGFFVAEDIIITMKGAVDLQRQYPLTVILSDRAPPSATGENASNAVHYPSAGAWSLGTTASWDTWSTQVTSGTITMGLYIGKNASPGTYTLPFVGNTFGGCIPKLATASEKNTIIEIIGKPNLECTVSAPPTIDFGTIHGLDVKENLYISQETGNININCTSSSQDATASAKIQVLGPTEEYGYILSLYNEDNKIAPGEIRGWINRPADNTCSGAAGVTDGLYFDDSSKWYSGGELKVGNNTIPYVFNLCGSGKNGASNLGRASTTATVNISWD